MLGMLLGAAKVAAIVAAVHHPAAAAPAYTVQNGDTLSGIAASNCQGKANDWTGIYARNRAVIGSNPNLILAGQKLRLACHEEVVSSGQSPQLTASTSKTDRWDGQHHACGDGDGDGYDMPCSYLHQHYPSVNPGGPDIPASAPAQPVASYSGAPGSFQACVIRAESGGNPRAVNASSGAGGLYQFLPSTWQSLGFSGLPQNASVAEQNAAFQKEYAQSGTSAWGPYDGC